MQAIRIILSAFAALRTNWKRSLLTILGIVIGVLSIVLVVALGQGAQDLILGQIRGVGANFISVSPGRQSNDPTSFYTTLFSDSLKEKDVVALRQASNVPNLESVSPTVAVPGTVSYLDVTYRPVVFGWTMEELANMVNITPAEGEFFTDDDITQRAKIAVIGWTVRQKLFGDSDAVGKLVTIRGRKVRVVGVMDPYGQVLGLNLDEIVIIPYTTAQKDFLAQDHYQELHTRAADGADVEQVADDIRATLREMHGITDPAKDDFTVMTQKDVAKRVSTVTSVLTIFLVMIASISLIVGGIGIMNIMLVSVTERTQEIGLRKAVGAREKDILQQFLLEAVMLTASGGLLGTVLALAISFLISIIVRAKYALDWPFSVPYGAIGLGIFTAAAIGLVFGLYPARQAARKDPIEALRYE